MPIEEGFVDATALMHCGVYMLIHRGEVVYVGQSKSLGERLRTHCRNRNGKVRRSGLYGNRVKLGFSFDSIVIKGCMLGELDELEVSMIKKYKPKYNVKHMPAKPCLELQMLIEMMPAICMQPQSDSPQPRQTAPWRRL